MHCGYYLTCTEGGQQAGIIRTMDTSKGTHRCPAVLIMKVLSEADHAQLRHEKETLLMLNSDCVKNLCLLFFTADNNTALTLLQN